MRPYDWRVVVDGVVYCGWFTRRRYGRTTFTWIRVHTPGKPWGDEVDVGDPWPCINPKRAEMAVEVAVRVSSLTAEYALRAAAV